MILCHRGSWMKFFLCIAAFCGLAGHASEASVAKKGSKGNKAARQLSTVRQEKKQEIEKLLAAHKDTDVYELLLGDIERQTLLLGIMANQEACSQLNLNGERKFNLKYRCELAKINNAAQRAAPENKKLIISLLSDKSYKKLHDLVLGDADLQELLLTVLEQKNSLQLNLNSCDEFELKNWCPLALMDREDQTEMNRRKRKKNPLALMDRANQTEMNRRECGNNPGYEFFKNLGQKLYAAEEQPSLPLRSNNSLSENSDSENENESW